MSPHSTLASVRAGAPTTVTVLKPVCGEEAALYEQLRSFCVQQYPRYQLIFGVRDANDWYGKTYYAESAASDPKGPASGSKHIIRGGSWNNDATNCRSAFSLSIAALITIKSASLPGVSAPICASRSATMGHAFHSRLSPIAAANVAKYPGKPLIS